MKTVAIVVLLLMSIGAFGQNGSLTIGCDGTVHQTHAGTLTEVKPLSAEQLQKLKDANSVVGKAQAELDKVEQDVRGSFGDRQCPDPSYAIFCTGGTDVVFEGKFALIYNWTTSSIGDLHIK